MFRHACIDIWYGRFSKWCSMAVLDCNMWEIIYLRCMMILVCSNCSSAFLGGGRVRKSSGLNCNLLCSYVQDDGKTMSHEQFGWWMLCSFHSDSAGLTPSDSCVWGAKRPSNTWSLGHSSSMTIFTYIYYTYNSIIITIMYVFPFAFIAFTPTTPWMSAK